MGIFSHIIIGYLYSFMWFFFNTLTIFWNFFFVILFTELDECLKTKPFELSPKQTSI